MSNIHDFFSGAVCKFAIIFSQETNVGSCTTNFGHLRGGTISVDKNTLQECLFFLIGSREKEWIKIFRIITCVLCIANCRAICNRQEAVRLAENQRIKKLDKVMGRTGNCRWGVWDQESKPLNLALLCIVMGDKIYQPKLPTKIPPKT